MKADRLVEVSNRARRIPEFQTCYPPVDERLREGRVKTERLGELRKRPLEVTSVETLDAFVVPD